MLKGDGKDNSKKTQAWYACAAERRAGGWMDERLRNYKSLSKFLGYVD